MVKGRRRRRVLLSSDRWNLKEENGMMNCIARQDKKERESQKTEDLSRKNLMPNRMAFLVACLHVASPVIVKRKQHATAACGTDSVRATLPAL